jgi:hypothetical protein
MRGLPDRNAAPPGARAPPLRPMHKANAARRRPAAPGMQARNPHPGPAAAGDADKITHSRVTLRITEMSVEQGRPAREPLCKTAWITAARRIKHGDQMG